MEQLLSELIYPEEGFELQAVALQSQLRNKLQKLDNYQKLYDGDGQNLMTDQFDKRSVSALARNGLLQGKRNVGALARSGLLRGSPVDVIKRSLATLAKNGQLPSKEPETEDMLPSDNEGWLDEKRSLASLARAGYAYNGKRSVQSLARHNELPSNSGKRSITSLVRNGLYPQYNLDSKRTIPAILKNYIIPSHDKKNVGKLARDWMLPNLPKSHAEKRDVKSVEGE